MVLHTFYPQITPLYIERRREYELAFCCHNAYLTNSLICLQYQFIVLCQ